MRSIPILLLLCASFPLSAHGIALGAGTSFHNGYWQPTSTASLFLQKEIGPLVGRYATLFRYAAGGNVRDYRSLRKHHGIGIALAIGCQSSRWGILMEAAAMRLWMRGDGVSLCYALTLIPLFKIHSYASIFIPISVELQSGITTYSTAIGLQLDFPS